MLPNCAISIYISITAPSNTNGSNQPWSMCLKNVHRNQISKLCCKCDKLIHIKCDNILSGDFEFPLENWVCLSCTIHNNSKFFPFTIESEELLQKKNCMDFPLLTDSMPSFKISSKLTNLPNLSDYDTDDNINKKICSQYCSAHQMSSLLTSNIQDYKISVNQ